MTSRIFDDPAVPKDKLDYRNSIRSYLETSGEGVEDMGKPEPEPGDRLDEDLQKLKMKAFLAESRKLDCTNPEIFFKVKTKIARVLEEGRYRVLNPQEFQDQLSLNRNELNICRIGDRNYSLFYHEDSVSFEFHFDLKSESIDSRHYKGSIRGWAEAGVHKTVFSVTDVQSDGFIGGDADLSDRVRDFLSRIDVQKVYEVISSRCEEAMKRSQAPDTRVQKEAQEKISRALDDLI